MSNELYRFNYVDDPNLTKELVCERARTYLINEGAQWKPGWDMRLLYSSEMDGGEIYSFIVWGEYEKSC